MTEEELAALLRRTLPARDIHDLVVEAIEEGEIRLRFPFRPDHVGPGDIVSGPLLLSHADTAIYAAAQYDLPAGQIAVTSSINVSFLRPAQASDVITLSRTLRRGKRLVHAEAWLFSHSAVEPIAHVTASCAVLQRSV